MVRRLKKIIGKHENSSKKWFEHYNKNAAYQASEYICKSHPPVECSNEELKWIINNTMHFWNIDHCIEYNKRMM